MSAGDVIYEYGFWLLPTSKNATAAISKGDVVSLPDGRKCATGDSGPFGVAITDIASGENMQGKVLIKGTAKVVTSGAISQFAYVAPDNNGKVKAAGATDSKVGVALEAASASGDIITIILL